MNGRTTAARLACLTFLLLGVRIAAAAPVATDLTRPFLLIQGSDLGKLSSELDRVSAAGYRVVCTSPQPRADTLWGSSGIAMLLEKLPATAAPYAYRLVRAFPNGPSPKRWHEVLDGPGSQGFRFVPAFSVHRFLNVQSIGTGPSGMVWVLERSPEVHRFEYRLHTPGSAKSLAEAVAEDAVAGFEVVAMQACDAMLMLVAERNTDETPATVAGQEADRYLYVDSVRRSGLRRRVREAAAKGYRVRDASAYSLRGGARSVLLERSATVAAPYSYEFVSADDPTGLERVLQDAGARGYRVHPRRLEAGLLYLEKAPGTSEVYSYRVLAPASTAALESELVTAAAAGYSVIAMMDGAAVVLEKLETPAGH